MVPNARTGRKPREDEDRDKGSTVTSHDARHQRQPEVRQPEAMTGTGKDSPALPSQGTTPANAFLTSSRQC